MTIQEIRAELERRGKKLSRPGIYAHIKALGLKPRGIGRPAIYPANSAELICKRLGLKKGGQS